MGDAITTLRDGEASWHDRLARVPADRVVHLSGVSAEGIATAVARFDDLPAAVVATPSAAGSVAALVSEVLDGLDTVARQLLPGWLPEADGLDGPQGAALAAIRAVAIERARVVGCSSAFLADLAERALTGRFSRARLRPEVRVSGLARVIATGFRRDRLVLTLPIETGPGETPVGDVVVAGAEWLADHGRLGVWLTGPESPGPERIGTLHLVPVSQDTPATSSGDAVAVVGRPHPRSTVEAALEAVLARQEWAYGRTWNGTYQPTLVRSPIRPDLLWAAERVVVELDGPEHCRPEQYDADRVRDVRLQLDGYAVLRFTNARVKHDVHAVAAQIRQLVMTRRNDMAKGRQGG
ncbi:endonuclease domain-containing protein [Actinoallomurus acaciae]|uniref:Endonuclease domain-containing protein n=1 Tax=Actinoallomurus acaciae TaxID=502577 RepID=A0ABV5YG22_9ACTN